MITMSVLVMENASYRVIVRVIMVILEIHASTIPALELAITIAVMYVLGKVTVFNWIHVNAVRDIVGMIAVFMSVSE